MTGMIVIFSVVFPIVLVVGIMFFFLRGQKQNEELLRTGIPARGRILQLGTTGGSVAVMGHRHLRLTLTVEVHPQAGAPYVATFEQLVSELQIPSVQPGANIELRIDPQNPQRMTLASVGGAQPASPGWGQQAQGHPGQQQPQAAWGQPQGAAPYGAPGGAAPGWGAQAPMPMVAMTPNYKRAMPMIIFMMFITTVPIGAIMFFTFVDTSTWFGSSSSTKTSDDESEEDSETPAKKKKSTGGVCAQAAACCRVISGDNPAAAKGCDNLEQAMMPVEGCRQSLDGFKQSAKAMKKSCD